MSWIRENVRRMQGYVPGLQPDSADVVKLNTNENPYPPSPAVGSLLRDIEPADLKRYPDPVCRQVREIIADLHGCSMNQVFAGNGSDEVLALCLRAFVEQDQVVGCFEPSYSLYPVLAAIQDLVVQPTPLQDDFSWTEPAHNTALFFLTHPNAPTGMQYPREIIEAFCEAYPGVLVMDEAYADFAPWHCLDLALRSDHVLAIRTLSKSYSLAGIRFGYAVGHADLIAAMYKIKDSYNLDLLTQRIAAAALRDQACMREHVKRIVHTRERLTAALEGRGFRVAPSATNFVWARPPAPGAHALYETLCARHIYVRHFNQERIRDFVRISVGTEAETDRLLTALDQILGAAGTAQQW